MGAKQLTIGATWQWGLIPMRLSLSLIAISPTNRRLGS